MTAAEEWRRIPTDPDYEASSLGRIRSWKRSNGRILTQKPTGPYAYLTVRIRVNGRNRITQVHRLVATAFYGVRPEGLMTRHLDGDNQNNAPSNLRYGTQSENELDKVRHGTHPMARKTHCAQGHAYTPENTVVRDGRWRLCRTCQLNRWRAESERQKAERHARKAVA